MTPHDDPPADEDLAFEALVRASKVPIGEAEKQELRRAYSALAALAARVRKPGRSWEVRMLPYFCPKRRKPAP